LATLLLAVLRLAPFFFLFALAERLVRLGGITPPAIRLADRLFLADLFLVPNDFLRESN